MLSAMTASGPAVMPAAAAEDSTTPATSGAAAHLGHEEKNKIGYTLKSITVRLRAAAGLEIARHELS